MSTETRVVRAGSVPMYDAQGNRYTVTITARQVRASYTEGGNTGWIGDSKIYECEQGRVNPLGDGSFQLATSGVLIYPKSRLPRESEQQAQTPPAP